MIKVRQSEKNEIVKVFKEKEQQRIEIQAMEEEKAKKLFEAISDFDEKPNFEWKRVTFYDSESGKEMYKIKCIDSKSDELFTRIKGIIGISAMQVNTIDTKLIPLTNAIWWIQTEKKNLKYETLAMGVCAKNLDDGDPDDEDSDKEHPDPDFPEGGEGPDGIHRSWPTLEWTKSLETVPEEDIEWIKGSQIVEWDSKKTKNKRTVGSRKSKENNEPELQFPED